MAGRATCVDHKARRVHVKQRSRRVEVRARACGAPSGGVQRAANTERTELKQRASSCNPSYSSAQPGSHKHILQSTCHNPRDAIASRPKVRPRQSFQRSTDSLAIVLTTRPSRIPLWSDLSQMHHPADKRRTTRLSTKMQKVRHKKMQSQDAAQRKRPARRPRPRPLRMLMTLPKRPLTMPRRPTRTRLRPVRRVLRPVSMLAMMAP